MSNLFVRDKTKMSGRTGKHHQLARGGEGETKKCRKGGGGGGGGGG